MDDDRKLKNGGDSLDKMLSPSPSDPVDVDAEISALLKEMQEQETSLRDLQRIEDLRSEELHTMKHALANELESMREDHWKFEMFRDLDVLKEELIQRIEWKGEENSFSESSLLHPKANEVALSEEDELEAELEATRLQLEKAANDRMSLRTLKAKLEEEIEELRHLSESSMRGPL
mmetsp:Transcript_15824/g.26016  ORF Transcript_15824/g.26016 Transcript_15824/m.26016 type:complete len:176 (-) Transcript_15824:2051-2578(-)